VSHPRCTDGHICQQPSGRACDVRGCQEPAGTLWGPYWCPDHDKQRLERITANLESALADLKADR
jgi:hypothetical protein